MMICDRCRKRDPRYLNYIGSKYCDICEYCRKDYDNLEEIFISMEKTFMKGKILKHIDFQWEDINK